MDALVEQVENLAIEKGISKADACRELGIAASMYYNTKQKSPKFNALAKSRPRSDVFLQKVPIAQSIPRMIANKPDRIVVVAVDQSVIRELLSL